MHAQLVVRKIDQYIENRSPLNFITSTGAMLVFLFYKNKLQFTTEVQVHLSHMEYYRLQYSVKCATLSHICLKWGHMYLSFNN